MITIPAINIQNASFSYKDELTLIKINLRVEKGRFLGILGPNGSGKTTLLKLILGLLKPQEGTVELLGVDIKKFSLWNKIGYVPQRAGSENTSFPFSVQEIMEMSKAREGMINRALKEVGMFPFKDKLLKELSGGQKQRVFIARALAKEPEILILDEPTVGVDVDSQSKFYDLLKKLNRKYNLTTVLVSHDTEVVAREVDEIACVNRKIICHGNAKNILKDKISEKMYGKSLSYIIHGH